MPVRRHCSDAVPYQILYSIPRPHYSHAPPHTLPHTHLPLGCARCYPPPFQFRVLPAIPRLPFPYTALPLHRCADLLTLRITYTATCTTTYVSLTLGSIACAGSLVAFRRALRTPLFAHHGVPGTLLLSPRYTPVRVTCGSPPPFDPLPRYFAARWLLHHHTALRVICAYYTLTRTGTRDYPSPNLPCGPLRFDVTYSTMGSRTRYTSPSYSVRLRNNLRQLLRLEPPRGFYGSHYACSLHVSAVTPIAGDITTTWPTFPIYL